jgi:hypothetical protein
VHDDTECVVMRLRAKVYASVVPIHGDESGVLARISTEGLPCASGVAGSIGCIGWRRRGVGELRLLRHRHTGRTRVVMREENTLVVRLNFAVAPAPGMLRRSPTCDRTVLVTACDFSSGVGSRRYARDWPCKRVRPQLRTSNWGQCVWDSSSTACQCGWDSSPGACLCWKEDPMRPMHGRAGAAGEAPCGRCKDNFMRGKGSRCKWQIYAQGSRRCEDHAGRQIYALKFASQVESEGFCQAFTEASA